MSSRILGRFGVVRGLTRLLAGLLIGLSALPLPANAGRSCESQPMNLNTVRNALALAERTAARLDETGAHVVVLARAGQDLGAWGLRYSHLGLAYREPAANDAVPPRAARWLVVHKLNHCGSATGAVYRQGLGEFFMDDLFRLEAAVVVPTPQVQARLMAVLQDRQRITQLDTAAYNMLAYPWAQVYQQSNQWALETLAMAMDDAAGTRERAQAWLRLQGYEPTVLHIDALKRLGARMFRANVAFDDHPNAERFSDRIATVSVDSVFVWMQRSGLGSRVQILR